MEHYARWENRQVEEKTLAAASEEEKDFYLLTQVQCRQLTQRKAACVQSNLLQ